MEGTRKSPAEDPREAAPAPTEERYPLILVVSPTFENEHPIPVDYTRDGDDYSPRIGWATIPRGTRSFALLCENPEGPRGKPFLHWSIFNIPRVLVGVPFCELPKGVSKTPRPPEVPGAVQGRNDYDEVGYGGPTAPKGGGVARYFFRLYALDVLLTLGPEADREELLRAMKGHIVGYGHVVGTYRGRE
jgi:Raf kinase inhibitor-like YbhB/YbcL family protein